MIAEFIVMFRESLEVAFVIGVMLAYLHKTKNEEHEKHVWLGVGAAVVSSLLLAYLFQYVQGGFEANEALFEGFFMIATAALVSWMILWIVKQKRIVESLQADLRHALEKKETLALFFLAFSATLRESVEAVLFLYGIMLNTGAVSILGGIIGLAAALIVGILVFEYSIRFNIGLFFGITTAILVLLAAGLFSQGLHELQEAGLLPVWVEHVYDINPPLDPDGTYPLLHEKGAVGGIFKGLVGYDGNPSDLQVIGYAFYLVAIFIAYKKS